MSRYSRSLFLFVAILVGLLSPATDLDDMTVAATVRDPLATLDDPDVDPVGIDDHLTSRVTDPIFHSCCLPKASLVLLRQVLPSEGPNAARRRVLSCRITRAPPSANLRRTLSVPLGPAA